MPITTTPRQIMEGNAGMQALAQARLPVKAAYAVSKLAKACQREVEDYSKQREKIFTDGGCTIVVKGKNPDGTERKEWVHPDGKEKLDPVIQQAEELADTQLELNALPLDLEQFGNADVPGYAFIGLDWAMKPEEASA